jgi:NADH:ubiquinone oxidoreductase subunit F (NADH-binding)
MSTSSEYGSQSTQAAQPGAVGLPRLLAGIPGHGVLSLREHLELHGELPRSRGRRGRGEQELIEQVEQAGLCGRGGGGFPAGTKLRAVAGASRSPVGGRPTVVINGAEGEPASFKDRTLLSALPHLVLDGGELAARAVGAEEVLLCVCESATAALRGASDALAERERSRRADAPHTRLVTVPNRYLASQESALVNHLNGAPAIPGFTPPLPFERGVHHRPTLISNAETLAHMALIARHGPAWFRELGSASEPGSALVTLSGCVPYPGVYEIELGSPLPTLLEAAGGLQRELRAVLVGGYSGIWVDGALLHRVALSDQHLAPYGGALGAGVVALLSSEACPVAELARLTRWLAAQSARQCGPCKFGLDAIAATMEQLACATAGPDAERRLASLGALVRGRGACGHPDGVARLVASALEVFAEELADHAEHGPCAACVRPSELPRPRTSEAVRRADTTEHGSRARSREPEQVASR